MIECRVSLIKYGIWEVEGDRRNWQRAGNGCVASVQKSWAVGVTQCAERLCDEGIRLVDEGQAGNTASMTI